MQEPETKEPNRWKEPVFCVGAALLLMGALMYSLCPIACPWVFSAGALVLIVLRALTPRKGMDFRQKRLQGMRYIAALLYIPTAYFMFVGSDIWLLLLLISAVLEMVTAFRG